VVLWFPYPERRFDGAPLPRPGAELMPTKSQKC